MCANVSPVSPLCTYAYVSRLCICTYVYVSRLCICTYVFSAMRANAPPVSPWCTDVSRLFIRKCTCVYAYVYMYALVCAPICSVCTRAQARSRAHTTGHSKLRAHDEHAAVRQSRQAAQGRQSGRRRSQLQRLHAPSRRRYSLTCVWLCISVCTTCTYVFTRSHSKMHTLTRARARTHAHTHTHAHDKFGVVSQITRGQRRWWDSGRQARRALRPCTCRGCRT